MFTTPHLWQCCAHLAACLIHALQRCSLYLITWLLWALASTAPAQAQNVLDGFNANANDWVLSLAVQPDGKVLLGGYFSQINGTPRNYIARLNADGSLDTSLDPGSGANASVYSLAVQPDGKVLLGGDFTQVNGTPRSRIARLNADGSLDTSFAPDSGANASVYGLAVQPDGKVLLGGDFTQVNGTPHNHIARLNADGSLDTSLDPGSGANSTVQSLAVQPDGKVLLGGAFTEINGTPRSRIARLNADGSLDTSFAPGSGADSTVYSLAVQPDGKVLLGGVHRNQRHAAQPHCPPECRWLAGCQL